MTTADLLYSDVEDSLRGVVRDVLTDRLSTAEISAMYDGRRGAADCVWRVLAADLGLAGLLVPEHLGGAGGTASEAAVVLEELGRAAAPAPFLTSAVIATSILVEAGADDLTGAVASGRRTATVGVPFTLGPGAPVGGRFTEVGGVLTGTVTSVAGAIEADVFIVPVTTGDGTALWVIDVDHVEVTPVVSLDMTRQLADLAVAGAPGRPLVPVGQGAYVLGRALTLGAALLASEQVGIAQSCLDEAVAYLMARRQFGRVVGGFQALKHRLADLYCAVESARAAARYAAFCAATGAADLDVAGATAQAFCAEAAVHAAEECLQLHGGIGMTWEHPAHLHLKRAKVDELALGTPDAHRLRLGELVDLPQR